MAGGYPMYTEEYHGETRNQSSRGRGRGRRGLPYSHSRGRGNSSGRGRQGNRSNSQQPHSHSQNSFYSEQYTEEDAGLAYQTFIQKAQHGLPAVLIPASTGQPAQALQPCFRFHLQDRMFEFPRFIGRLVKEGYSDKYKMEFIDQVMAGCTQMNCPFVHKLPANVLMPPCWVHGTHQSEAICNRLPTCILLHRNDIPAAGGGYHLGTSIRPPTAMPTSFQSAEQYQHWRDSQPHTLRAPPATTTQQLSQVQSASWQQHIGDDTAVPAATFSTSGTGASSSRLVTVLQTPQADMQTDPEVISQTQIHNVLQLLEHKHMLELLTSPEIVKIPKVQQLLLLLCEPEYDCQLIQEWVLQNVNELPPSLPAVEEDHANQGVSYFDIFYKSSHKFATFVDLRQFRCVVSIFSRGAAAFQRVPSAPEDSPLCKKLIQSLASLTPTFDPTKDKGCLVFFQLYLRLRCTHQHHPVTDINLLNDNPFNTFYNTREYVLQHWEDSRLGAILDKNQLLTLELLVFDFNQDVVNTGNVHSMHFYTSFSSYLKTASFFTFLDSCIMQYISPGYSEPILHLDGRRLNSKIAVVHREHPLFSNFAALLNRIHTLGSHKAVCVDPAFIGTQFPAASCPAMDKYAFTAFVLALDTILGSKPNVSHSSSSYNCLDRYNNFLHYTIDNMRWADSATNFQNKPKSSQYNGGMEKRLGKKIDTQFATLRRILTKQKSKPTLL